MRKEMINLSIEDSILDRIIVDGFRRIDEAVDKVIDSHTWLTPEENYAMKKYRFELGKYAPGDSIIAQRLYNYRMSAMVESLAVSPNLKYKPLDFT